jgi:Domain of unknown function (DUF4406)
MTGKDEVKQKKETKMWQQYHEEKGFKVVNPFDIGRELALKHMSKGIKLPTYNEYMIADLKALDKCTHIFFCKDWSDSKGCMIECDRAIKLGLVNDTYIRPR